jgi:hypothetical protein
MLYNLREVAMNEEILTLFESLSPQAQRQALAFLTLLKERSSKTRRTARRSLRQESFIGLWRGREEMTSSGDWVRETRWREWGM